MVSKNRERARFFHLHLHLDFSKRRKLWKVDPQLMLQDSTSLPTSNESSINPSSDFTSTDSSSNIQSSRCFPKITTGSSSSSIHFKIFYLQSPNSWIG